MIPRSNASPPGRAAATALPLLLLALAGCGRGDGDRVQASGQIEATQVRIAAQVQGTVARLEVEEGDRVTAGQLMAVIDTVDLEIERRQAAADRDQAAANLALVEAGPRIEDVRAARAEVARREADLTGAERDLARMQALLDAGSGAEKPRDDARVRRDMARAALDAARETLAKLERGARPEERAAARASLARAQAHLDAIVQRLADCHVTAPLTGTVTGKLVEVGELVSPGTGLVEVGDLEHPWLTAFITGRQLPRVRLGATARVVTDARDDAGREGRVSYVSPTSEFTPRNVQTQDERAKLVYRVKILLDNRDGALKPGMPADAWIAAAAPGAAEPR